MLALSAGVADGGLSPQARGKRIGQDETHLAEGPILWHSRGTMTGHYSVAQVRELLDALNLITDESNRKNASLEMLFREKAESLQSSFKKKMGQAEISLTH